MLHVCFFIDVDGADFESNQLLCVLESSTHQIRYSLL